MKSESWKTLAIIFIILFVVETVYVFLSVALGMQILAAEAQEAEKKEKCMTEICDIENVVSFYYANGICYCYDKNREVIKKEKL